MSLSARLLAVLVACLTGCSTPAGPGPGEDFDARLRQSVAATNSGPVRLAGEGMWHPSTRGFTTLRTMPVSQWPQEVLAGIALTDTAIIVAQWAPDSNRFEIVKRIDVADLREAWVDSFGRGRRLVVRRADLGYDSFTFMRHGTAMVDQDATEQALALLRARVPDRSPPSD
jgi:hypothetical protein